MWKGNNVALQQGGYAASLHVSRELHCLVRPQAVFDQWRHSLTCRQSWLKLSYLNPASQDFHSDREEEHFDHCINVLKQQRMCHADLTVESWFWKDGDFSTPWPRTKGKRLCVNFGQVRDWLDLRGIRSSEGFVHPDGRNVDMNDLAKFSVSEVA